jgi:hypothetical protein
MNLTLFSAGLLSKWGFNDGDEPDAWLDWAEERLTRDELHEYDWHDVLRHLVRTRLVPALDQRVEVIEMA